MMGLNSSILHLEVGTVFYHPTFKYYGVVLSKELGEKYLSISVLHTQEGKISRVTYDLESIEDRLRFPLLRVI